MLSKRLIVILLVVIASLISLIMVEQESTVFLRNDSSMVATDQVAVQGDSETELTEKEAESLEQSVQEGYSKAQGDDGDDSEWSKVGKLAKKSESDDDGIKVQGPVAPYCFSTKTHFIPESLQRPSSIALASFPGSGNTWLRYLIEQGSRIYTGSWYEDKHLNKTYIGEGVRNSSVVVIKTHYPCDGCWNYMPPYNHKIVLPIHIPMSGHVEGSDAVIYLIRSPFDTLLAEFNRMKTGLHRGSIPPDLFTRKKSSVEDLSWFEFVRLRSDAWYRSVKYHFFTPINHNLTSVIGGKQPRLAKAREFAHFKDKVGRLVHIVFYEQLKRDSERVMVKLYQFLHALFEDNSKSVFNSTPEEAAACAIAQYKKAMRAFRWKRDHSNRFNPFGPIMKSTICEKAKDYWREDVWGPCNGQLQWERNDIEQK